MGKGSISIINVIVKLISAFVGYKTGSYLSEEYIIPIENDYLLMLIVASCIVFVIYALTQLVSAHQTILDHSLLGGALHTLLIVVTGTIVFKAGFLASEQLPQLMRFMFPNI